MKLQGDTCPICLEAFPTSTSTVQPCNHSFCCACISTWASLRATCPLCLEPFQTICVSTEEEDTKEEIIKINDPSNAYLKREEEDFECLDHKHFLKEFQALYKRAKETEFELKARVMVKKGAGATERDYQIIMHMKQEIELKLAFLAQERKIFPKELLGEIEHFSGMIKSFSYGGEKTREIEIGYVHDIYVEEEYYEGQETQNDGYCLFDFAVKKSGKGKKRNNRRGKTKENLSAWDE